MQLNEHALQIVLDAQNRADELKIVAGFLDGVRILDFGVHAEGGLQAGLILARLCLAGIGDVSLAPQGAAHPDLPQVFVRTDHPVSACLASQYAGWKIAVEDYFAMGSGPMRAVANSEELFRELSVAESGEDAIGVLESGSLPTTSAISSIRRGLPEGCRITLAVAPTASQAGNLQVVARSVETALHKLHELGFPLDTLVSGTGAAPLPPVAKNDLHGIGRTNDAILYGATVNLWVRTDDQLIESFGPQVPSCSSPSHGETFLSLFKAANHDFYAMDKALFSPAVVHFHNLKTGRSFSFGRLLPELLRESFGL